MAEIDRHRPSEGVTLRWRTSTGPLPVVGETRKGESDGSY